MSEHLEKKSAAELPETTLAKHSLMLDDDKTRITQWVFAPGDQTGWHRHEYDYVVVPMTTGQLLLKEPEGERYAELTAGISYGREVGVEHNVINANEFEFVFIEVEIKP